MNQKVLMELKNKIESTEKPYYDTTLQDAWIRFVDFSETPEDLKMMLDSIRKRESILDEIYPPDPEEQEKLRKEAQRIYAKYLHKKKLQKTPWLLRSTQRTRKIWYTVSAAILLAILIPAVQLFINPNLKPAEEIAIHYIEVITERGEIKTIILSDQTKVTLNAESSLKYPAVFTEERNVELKGEAIFDVTNDKNRPFIVSAIDVDIRVLGTIFDVKTYPDDELSMVTVASGKIELKSTLTVHAPIQLEKSHQVMINKTIGNFEINTVDAEKYMSWTEGTLYFDRTPIKEVVNMLNRSNTEIVFELAEEQYPDLITGRLNTKNMGTILDTFVQALGFEYTQIGNKIILYNENDN